MSAWLERCRYGPARPPGVVILVPHADDGRELLAEHPEIADDCVANQELLRRYLAIEADAGSRELALAVADRLGADGGAVEVLLPRLPRGLIDPGRVPARALRHVFRLDAAPESLSLLGRAHAEVVGEVVTTVRGLDVDQGFFLDLHTMAPRSPTRMASSTEAVEERPNGLNAYVGAFVEAQGDHRVVDLITRVHGEVVADIHLLKALGKALDAADLPWLQDQPYSSGSHLVAGLLMRERRGITVDVPKDWLVAAGPERFVLGAERVDGERVGRVAGAIWEGVLASGDLRP